MLRYKFLVGPESFTINSLLLQLLPTRQGLLISRYCGLFARCRDIKPLGQSENRLAREPNDDAYAPIFIEFGLQTPVRSERKASQYKH